MRRLFSLQKPLSFRRTYLTHQTLLDKAFRAGYPNHGGVCHGLACVAAYCNLANKNTLFDRLLEKISRSDDFTNDKNILTFMDAIEFGQHPENYDVLKKTVSHHPQKQDALAALRYYAKKNVFSFTKTPFRSLNFSGIYEPSELEKLFSLLHLGLIKFRHPLSFIMSTHQHSIAFYFNPTKMQWSLLDANKLPIKHFKNTIDLPLKISHALLNKNKFVIQTQALTLLEHKATSNAFFAFLKATPEWKALHNAETKHALINTEGDSWLHIAAESGLIEEVDALLTTGADPNALLEASTTPLGFAVRNQHVKIAKMLLKAKAHVNMGDPPPLAEAIENGDLTMIHLLLKNGASTNILIGNTEARQTVLEYAVQQHATHMIKLLLAYGANPNCGSPHVLLQALQTGQKNIATLLKRHGAKIGGTLLNDKARLFTKKPKSYSSPIQPENNVSLTNPSGNPL